MKRAFLVLLTLALLVLAGCGPQTNQPYRPVYLGGTHGLAISFAEGMPPLEVFDAGQMQFSVGVIVENVGESAVGLNSLNQNGYIELVGINPAQFNKAGQDLRIYFAERGIELNAARRGYDGTIISGGLALIEFQGMSYVPDRFGNRDITLRANACYEYRTYSDTEICIKDNVLENALDDTICTLTGAKAVSSSGAPVQITHVTQNPAGQNKIQVTFVVENLGTGLVFSPWSYQDQYGTGYSGDYCANTVGINPNRDVVHATVSVGELSGAYQISCPLLGGGNTGLVRLYQGNAATISCTIDTYGSVGSRIYTDSLHVDLWYTYFDWIETPILIRDTNVGLVERGLEERGSW